MFSNWLHFLDLAQSAWLTKMVLSTHIFYINVSTLKVHQRNDNSFPIECLRIVQCRIEVNVTITLPSTHAVRNVSALILAIKRTLNSPLVTLCKEERKLGVRGFWSYVRTSQLNIFPSHKFGLCASGMSRHLELFIFQNYLID